MYPVLIALAVLYGAVVGWLVPRVRYRLSVEPEEGWRSAGPCGHAVVGSAGGWVGGGRCAVCGGRYGPGALWSVAVMVLVCAGLAVAVGVRPELGVWLLAAPVAVVLAGIDWSVRRLPDVLTVPLGVAMAGLLGVVALLPGAGGSWPGALLGGLGLGGWYLLLFLIHPSGMGFGDVKLAVGLGCALGWYGWAVVIFGGFAGLLLGALYGVGLMVIRRVGRRATLAFGPFMIVGAWAGVVLGGWAVA